MSKVIPVNSDADVPVGKHSNVSAVKDDVESQNKKENQSAIDIAKQHKIKVIVGVLAVIFISLLPVFFEFIKVKFKKH